MRLLKDDSGQSVIEHIAVLAIILAAAGGAVWLVYQAVAARFNDIANNL